ncbi:hypothetical protein AB0O75_39845 [Streptomyces sp. NPDC088921]|uniref:hypothetical protein n=1 Tax=unclassified Streptomyces TaxID=2593676 RepID=UPI003433DC39
MRAPKPVEIERRVADRHALYDDDSRRINRNSNPNQNQNQNQNQPSLAAAWPPTTSPGPPLPAYVNARHRNGIVAQAQVSGRWSNLRGEPAGRVEVSASRSPGTASEG